MSLSNPKLKNPASKFIEWSGNVKNPCFYYYDKEKGENITLENPCFVVPLDELSTIKGFSQEDNTGIYSNEVKNSVKQVLNVRTFKGTDIVKGIYKDIKGHIIAAGGKFAKSIYAVMITPGENKEDRNYELVNVTFKGSSLGPWIDARIKIDNGIGLKLSINNEIKKTGSTEYFEPTIEKIKINSLTLKKAISFDEKLQIYLNQYLDQQKANIIEEENITKVDLSEEKSEEEIAAEKYMHETEENIDNFNDVEDLDDGLPF